MAAVSRIRNYGADFCLQRFGSVEVGARGGIELPDVPPVASWKPPPRASDREGAKAQVLMQ